MNTPNRELNRAAEALWIKWSRRIGLAAKLRTMRMARVSDGAVESPQFLAKKVGLAGWSCTIGAGAIPRGIS